MLVMKINYTTVYTIDKQVEALTFYTEKLGFLKKADMMIGDYHWLTLVSPDDPDGAELILDANDTPQIRALQKSFEKYGMMTPVIFVVQDIYAECQRLEGLGISLVDTPTVLGDYMFASFHDPCGNLLQIMQTENLPF